MPNGMGPLEGPIPPVYRVLGNVDRLRDDGMTNLLDRVKAIVVIEVREASDLVSPAYDDGTTTEADVIRRFQARFAHLHEQP